MIGRPSGKYMYKHSALFSNDFLIRFKGRPIYFLLTLLISVLSYLPLVAQDAGGGEADELKNLSLEDLMNIEVTSVSKRPEKLLETASAIQVVTSEDIHNFGANGIAEALYLAGNLQVAQRGSHSWAISARGFNTELANKLLVMMDGRTIYSPLFSGVYWDRQDYLMNDINQIEVISGPGGTLWGANAVNGVINITTKSAKETQGLLAEAGTGTELQTITGARYGGKLGENTYYRIYGRYVQHAGAVYEDSIASPDDWHLGQGGFRIDSNPNEKTTLTLQGDVYHNPAGLTFGKTSKVTGENVLGRWSKTFSENANMSLQLYYDRTYLTLPVAAFLDAPEGVLNDELNTYDADFQLRFKMGSHQQIVWGWGYRFTHDQLKNAPGLGFEPEDLDQNLVTAFLQDEITISNNLSFILGSKIEHNDYTGFVYEPNARIRLITGEAGMAWFSVSRAVRTPSRIDREVRQASPGYFPLLYGSDKFRAETLLAWEGGYRSQIGQRTTTAISLFYNQYDHIRSADIDPDTFFPISFQNGLEGETWGMEWRVTSQITDGWKLVASWNLLREDLRVKENYNDINNTYNEVSDPNWQFSLRSLFRLAEGLSLNPAFRWVDNLPANDGGVLTNVPSYSELDATLIWSLNDHFDLTIGGRNLLHDEHPEYGKPTGNNAYDRREAFERSIYVKLSVTF